MTKREATMKFDDAVSSNAVHCPLEDAIDSLTIDAEEILGLEGLDVDDFRDELTSVIYTAIHKYTRELLNSHFGLYK